MKRSIIIIYSIFVFLVPIFADESALQDESYLMAVLWQQTSAEYRALAYQAYNIATLRLQEDLKITTEKPKAIIVDIDETVLDNSPYNAAKIMRKMKYPEEFMQWIDSANCQAVPGALEFLIYAKKNNYEIFYISNRNIDCLKSTKKNLNKLGFPDADEKHIMLKENHAPKKDRRAKLEERYHISLLIGDNLVDFLHMFKGKAIEERFLETDKLKKEWGKKFIVLPNPMHGEWKKAIYEYKYFRDKNEKLHQKINHLRVFEPEE